MSRPVPKHVKQAVLERDGHKCAYCGTSLHYTLEPFDADPGTFLVKGTIPEVDHVIPRSRGGCNKADNLVASCGPCNYQKGTLTGEEYRARLLERAQ